MWRLPAKEKKTVRIIVVNFIRQMLIPARFPIFMLNISLQIAEASGYLEIFVTATKFLIAQFCKNLHSSILFLNRFVGKNALSIPVMTLHCVLKALFMNSLLHPLTGSKQRRSPPINSTVQPFLVPMSFLESGAHDCAGGEMVHIRGIPWWLPQQDRVGCALPLFFWYANKMTRMKCLYLKWQDV